MKTLLLTLTMLMVGCNLVALEAEDPQDPAKYDKFKAFEDKTYIR